MSKKEQHYSSKLPDVQLKVLTISESLRRHLYLFKTTTGVFSFRKLDLGTKIFIENMTIPEDPSVLLDLGCGYGPIGMVLGYNSPKSNIYFIDSNRRAIWCVRENVKLNLQHYKEHIHIFTGEYFKPIENKDIKFDAIYMNPPLRNGRKEFLGLFSIIPPFLKKKGFFEFVIKKKMGATYVSKYLTEKGMAEKINILCKRSGYWVFQCFFN